MTLFTLFLTFLKIGAFTFGGGYAMIPMIQDEVVGNGWMTIQELTNFIAISESTPGPFAINIATFIGMKNAGFLGAACATAGVVLPSFIIILLVARCYAGFVKNRYVVAALGGLRPAVVGLIASAVFSVAAVALLPNGWGGISSLDVKTVGIILVLALLQKWKKLHPIWLIVISAAAGILLFGIF